MATTAYTIQILQEMAVEAWSDEGQMLKACYEDIGESAESARQTWEDSYEAGGEDVDWQAVADYFKALAESL